ncbi:MULTISPECIES: ATP-binding cassette domain-containing protein [unclassified Streptomyces]|uniref:ABC transporter ATP-binding protein n=1 Tax=Streptomyces TaxID=1883 RepID=UPI0001C1AB8F|nr:MULTISPECIES: ATP-binding cassette domain-containing protein [unclassified Streptomyces]AEN13903.1 ABC transporter related protein [Streptomyces sp. SirexAA-E]MYR67865.1 ATP-binding cassette domain-containing protein [Streptomyces sp. SID4939]MYS00305.1 ATP-binding cassette domain-containing protein [Streptomyces sp. SID4940]MYT67792.1 ATP-binding cassette domain-containing protein [Streptomyces sp. SID8357]MYT86636.1 ATP-binding cassette domain-containing protein [Streptomyces sp. SID8360]
MEPVIEVRGLTARAGTAVLLDDVDLAVAPGEVTALVGPSGSGKTTVALALLGESAPGVRLTGTVGVAGTAVVSADGPTPLAPAVRGRVVAYMPQHPAHALNPARRIGSVLTELARLHRPEAHRRQAAAEYAAGALRTAGMPDGPATLRRFPHQFSGGQRQRVALAQVLVCGPRAVVLDEPSTGLDTVARLRLAGELARLAAQGIAVLLLSHDHDLVRAVAARTILLDRGRVTDMGGTAALLPVRPPAALPAPATGPSPSSGGRNALEAHGLSAWLRPGRRGEVLHDVTVRVPEAGCTGVVGPSGSGKTVLARCLAGLHERHDGRLALFGEPLPVLRHRTPRQIRAVQYVWQEVRNSFDERRTVLDQVARTAVRLRGLSPQEAVRRARQVWERLGLSSEQAARHAGALSGGELQRAALARALLAEPDVLICDEITTALDAVSTRLVTEEIARLRGESRTAVLWIGHDLRLVEQLADDLVVLDRGGVVDSGDRRAVLASPRSETTRLLLRSRDLGSAAVTGPSTPHGVQGKEQPQS